MRRKTRGVPAASRQTKTSFAPARREGRALVIEALVGLAITVVCLAVFTRLFAYSFQQNTYDSHRAEAITLAVNQAESFAADPVAAQARGDLTDNVDGYDVRCHVDESKTGNGILYTADISVSLDSKELYRLSVDHYASDDENEVR